MYKMSQAHTHGCAALSHYPREAFINNYVIVPSFFSDWLQLPGPNTRDTWRILRLCCQISYLCLGVLVNVARRMTYRLVLLPSALRATRSGTGVVENLVRYQVGGTDVAPLIVRPSNRMFSMRCVLKYVTHVYLIFVRLPWLLTLSDHSWCLLLHSYTDSGKPYDVLEYLNEYHVHETDSISVLSRYLLRWRGLRFTPQTISSFEIQPCASDSWLDFFISLNHWLIMYRVMNTRKLGWDWRDRIDRVKHGSRFCSVKRSDSLKRVSPVSLCRYKKKSSPHHVPHALIFDRRILFQRGVVSVSFRT